MESREGASKKASNRAEGRDSGVGCGSNLPGDSFADDGKREDADDAEGAEDGYYVRERNAFGHCDVGDGNVKGHGNGEKGTDEGDEKNSADGGLGDEGLRGEKFNDERAEDGGENHQREGDAKNVPETSEERTDRGNERLHPSL